MACFFRMLETINPTATGLDGVPEECFIQIAAPAFARPLPNITGGSVVQCSDTFKV